MPTVRILSLMPDYHRFDGHRHRVAVALRATTSNTLHEDLNGVEAFWLPPIDPEDAENVLPYSVDVEYGENVDDQTLDRLADCILWVFSNSPEVPSGTTYGVWIKTPGRWLWKEQMK